MIVSRAMQDSACRRAPALLLAIPIAQDGARPRAPHHRISVLGSEGLAIALGDHPIVGVGPLRSNSPDASSVAEPMAGWVSAPGWKRSSGLTTAATGNQPCCAGAGALPDHAYPGERDDVAAGYRNLMMHRSAPRLLAVSGERDALGDGASPADHDGAGEPVELAQELSTGGVECELDRDAPV